MGVTRFDFKTLGTSLLLCDSDFNAAWVCFKKLLETAPDMLSKLSAG
jgi:hypothetical protein